MNTMLNGWMSRWYRPVLRASDPLVRSVIDCLRATSIVFSSSEKCLDRVLPSLR